MSKPRKLTSEDIALFRAAAGKVRPLDDDKVHHPAARPPARPAALDHGPNPPEPTLPHGADSPAPERGDALDFARPGVQRRVARQLRRGQIRAQDDLDLHGMTVAAAARALEHFLAESRARGRRCVRIVHGKGTGSPQGRPTLKGEVDRWLRLRPEVLGFSSALPGDGGTGAVYVLLRSGTD